MKPIYDFQPPTDLLARYQLEPYRSGPERLRQVAVAFTGSPRKHHRDEDKVLLVSDPFSQQGFVYEFRAMDLVYAEELPNISTSDGSTLAMVRLWVRKGSRALRIVPFSVEDTAQHLADLW